MNFGETISNNDLDARFLVDYLCSLTLLIRGLYRSGGERADGGDPGDSADVGLLRWIPGDNGAARQLWCQLGARLFNASDGSGAGRTRRPRQVSYCCRSACLLCQLLLITVL